MTRGLLVLTVLVLLIGPGAQVAQGSTDVSGDPSITAHLVSASNFFAATIPADRCPSGPRTLLADLPAGVLGMAEVGGCRMWLDPTIYHLAGVHDVTAAQAAASRLCSLVVHEYGHLLGMRHAEDPQHIMYPLLSATPSTCPAMPAGYDMLFDGQHAQIARTMPPSEHDAPVPVPPLRPAVTSPAQKRPPAVAPSRSRPATKTRCRKIKGRRVCMSPKRSSRNRSATRARVRVRATAPPVVIACAGEHAAHER